MNRFLPLFICLITFTIGSAQTVIFHEEFTECIDKIAIDEDNDVLWMGTGISSGGKLFMRDKNGLRTDISELTSDVQFQSISALFMDEAKLYVGGYGGVAIVAPEDEFYTMYTTANSDLSYNNEMHTLVYDYDSELLYAGNLATSTDILSDDGWSQDNSLKRIAASAFDYEEDCTWLASSLGDLIRIKDGVKTTFNSSNSSLPSLPYFDMTIDLEGNIYLLVYDNGFVHFDGTNATHYTPQNSNLFGGTLYSIDVDLNGKVWFGHNGGITSFKDGSFTTFPLENDVDFFPIVSDIVVDNENHLWLGACGGLIEFILDPTSTEEIDDQQVNVFPNPNDGNFTFLAPKKGTLAIYNGMGEAVAIRTLKTGNNSIELNLPSGNYAFTFANHSTFQSGKLSLLK